MGHLDRRVRRQSSSPSTIDRTSSAVNWCRLWCEPSRSDVSVSRRSRASSKVVGERSVRGHLRRSRCRCRAGTRAIRSPTRVAAAVMMSRFPAYGGRKSPAPSTSTKMLTACALRVVREGGSIWGSCEQPVAGDVLLHLCHHAMDRLGDRVAGCARGLRRDRAEDRVAHDHRRIGRVEDDDRLALLGAPDHLDAADGRARELVDVLPRPRAGRARGDRGDDLGVRHRRHPGDRGDHRDRRLAAAGHHVDVRSVEVARRGSPGGSPQGRPRPGSGRRRGCRPPRSAGRTRGARRPTSPRRPGRAARPA